MSRCQGRLARQVADVFRADSALTGAVEAAYSVGGEGVTEAVGDDGGNGDIVMDVMDTMETPAKSRWRGKAAAFGLVAAGAVAGGVLASTLTASAADSSNNTARTHGYGVTTGGVPDGHCGPMGGARPMRPDETQLTGSDAAKAKAAALEAVPGGKVIRVETDAGDAKYEAHMTKADGTLVTVKMDKDFNVTAVEDGLGKGDPRPYGPAPAARRHRPAPDSSAISTEGAPCGTNRAGLPHP